MIGFDLGKKFLKICKILNKDKKKNSYSIVSAMQDISTLDDSLKKLAVETVLNRINCNKERFYIAIGGQDIITKDIVVKQTKNGNFRDKVMEEVKASVSENINKMYSSYSIINHVSDVDVEVIFSATPVEKISKKINFVKNFQNISLKGVTLESFALTNAFEEFGPNYKNTETLVLINIGYENTNIVVLNNKKLVFVKDISFGGQDITRDISSVYQIPERLAEELKRRESLQKEINFNMNNVLKRNVAVLIETIFRTIEYCITRQFIVAVDRIVLTGGASLTENIDSFLEDTLGIPTEKWNPLENNNIEGYTNKEQGFFLPIALGLALEKEKTNV